ncbi:Venom serine carboxypeptidase [Diplonema papillatum]|nr:Venom serine carboxypeptidase [Diplonema papillatum]
MNRVLAVLLLGCLAASEPLFLSEMVKNGNIAKAQAAAAVQLPGLPDLKSYSGYFNVNESAHSETFFWYFPPLNGNASAPTLLWLQGGPGASSLFALFTENGPITVNMNGTQALRNDLTWAREYGMVYVDNPVGTGFSLTDPAGYATKREDYMTTLYRFTQQFFTMFPDLQQNDFYVTGESYAGKYIPSAAYRIHEENMKGGKPQIPLKGIIIGDGLCDPLTMVQQYSKLTETFSLVDWNQVKVMEQYQTNAVNDIYAQNWSAAFHQFDLMINGDLSGLTPYLANVTGFSDYFNALSPMYPQPLNGDAVPFQVYLNRPDVQAAIHVNKTYNSYTEPVEVAIVNDVCQSVKDLFPTLLENYKVLLYSGQFDVIVGAPLTIAFLRSIQWSGQGAFEIATRDIWRSRPPVVGVMGQLHGSTDVAGYHTRSGNLQYVIVRNAGHMVPTDQPVWAIDMITRFIRGDSFTGPVPSGVPNPTGRSDIVSDLRQLAELHASGAITADEYAKAKSKLLQ